MELDGSGGRMVPLLEIRDVGPPRVRKLAAIPPCASIGVHGHHMRMPVWAHGEFPGELGKGVRPLGRCRREALEERSPQLPPPACIRLARGRGGLMTAQRLPEIGDA